MVSQSQTIDNVLSYCTEGKLSKLVESFSVAQRSGTCISALVNVHFSDGQTCLIAACRTGKLNIVKYLVEECGADVEQVGTVTFDGETVEGVPPLWCASAANKPEVVRYLVEHGANVNRTTITNSTALRAACFDGHEMVVRFLVEHGADVEIPNRHGHTCLMISCFRGHFNITLFLLSKGARVNRRSAKGNTALHDCAESGRLESLQLLLQHGAVMRKDEYGQSPIMSGANSGYKKTVSFLSRLKKSGIESGKFEESNSNSLAFGAPPSEAGTLADELAVPVDEQAASYELLGAALFDRQSQVQDAVEAWLTAMNLRMRHFGYKKRLPVPPERESNKPYAWALIEKAAKEAVSFEKATNRGSGSKRIRRITPQVPLPLPSAITEDAKWLMLYAKESETIESAYSSAYEKWIASKPKPTNTIHHRNLPEWKHQTGETTSTWKNNKAASWNPLGVGEFYSSTAADAVLGIEPVVWNSPQHRRHPLEPPISPPQESKDYHDPKGDPVASEMDTSSPVLNQSEPSTSAGNQEMGAEREKEEDPLVQRLRKKSLAAFGHVREFADNAEMNETVRDITALRLQPLLMRLRILGPDHPDTIYFIRFRGATYADMCIIRQCLTLWRYALDLQRIFLEPLCHVSQSSFLSFAELFHIILSNRYSGMPTVGLLPSRIIDCIELSVDNIERGMEYSYNRWNNRHPWSYTTADKEATNLLRHVSLCLHFIAMVLFYFCPPNVQPPILVSRRLILLRRQNYDVNLPITEDVNGPGIPFGPQEQMLPGGGFVLGQQSISSLYLPTEAEYLTLRQKMTPALLDRFFKQVNRLVRVDPRVHQGHTVVHLACTPESAQIGRHDLFPFPYTDAIRLLCSLGANPDALDANGQRPIGIILSSRHITEDCKAEYIACLVNQVGAHLDATNKNGMSLLDPVCRPILAKTKLRVFDHISLKCLAARAVRRCLKSTETAFTNAALLALEAEGITDDMLYFLSLH